MQAMNARVIEGTVEGRNHLPVWIILQGGERVGSTEGLARLWSTAGGPDPLGVQMADAARKGSPARSRSSTAY